MPEQRDSTGTLDDYSSPQFAENSEDADFLNAPEATFSKSERAQPQLRPVDPQSVIFSISTHA